MMKKITFVTLLILLGFSLVKAQNNKREPGDLLQFSGVVVSGDSLQPVPFTAITIKGTYRGTLSDYYGFFSFVAQEGDTIEFSVLGFQKSTYILPDSLDGSRYSIIQVLNQDTVMLPTTVIYPWPTKEQIYEYFMFNYFWLNLLKRSSIVLKTSTTGGVTKITSGLWTLSSRTNPFL